MKLEFDILVRKGDISLPALKRCVEYSRESGEPLTDVLLKLGGVEKQTLGEMLGRAYGCRFVSFDPVYRSAPTASHVKSTFLHREVWIALRDPGGQTIVVIDDPDDIQRRDAINKIFNDEDVQWCVGVPSDIHWFIDYLYRGSIGETTLNQSVLDTYNPAETDARPPQKKGTARPDIVQYDGEASHVIIDLANQIIRSACKRGASDIHLEPYPDDRPMSVRLRVDGRCMVYDTVPNELEDSLVARVKVMAGLDLAQKRLPQDGKIRFRDFDKDLDIELRVATMPTAGGVEDVVLRILAGTRCLSLDEIGLDPSDLEVIDRLFEMPNGMVLVTGPTGSGKTTLLHAALAKINRPDTKIWTVEDPVEITQFGLRQIQVIPRIGLTFGTVLRSLLRADPDVIMIGEMRDAETAAVCVEAALTGHLVLSTLHTNSAIETIVRLLDLQVEPFAFADSLQGIIAQRLVRKLCLKCRQDYTPLPEEYSQLRTEYGHESFDEFAPPLEGLQLKRAVGCEDCLNTGYSGRSGIFEVLPVSDALRRRVGQRENLFRLRAQAERDGLITLKQDGIRKVLKGVTDLKEVRKFCTR